MSFLKRLFGRSQPEAPNNPSTNGPASAEVRLPVAAAGPVQLKGTTTIARDSIRALAARLDPEDNGHFETHGVLQREPDNPVDPNAVAVHVEGERIGYLPGYVASQIALTAQGALTIPVQAFTQLMERGLRAEAWVWLGDGEPRWQWSELNRPPLSPRAKAQASQRHADDLVNDAIAGGGVRAARFGAGMVEGVHYLQLVEPIKQLKRDGHLEEALALSYKAIQAAEASARFEKLTPAPFYTEQAAIIHRKLGQRVEEIAVLRRYLAACPDGHGGRIQERLQKLTE